MTDPTDDDDAREDIVQTRPLPVVGAPIETPARWTRGPSTAPGARLAALAVMLVGLAGIWLTWRVLVAVPSGQQLEARAMTGAEYGQGKLWRLAEPVLDVVSVSFVVLGLIAAMVIALMRLRWGLAVQVAILVAGSNITTQLLKHRLLDRPDLGVAGRHVNNTLPSGHTTVAASVSMALVLVVPRRLRPAVAVLGAGYTAATGVSTLVGQWHRPSDVIAALLVVLAWTALVCALTTPSGLDRDSRGGRKAASAAVPTAVGATVLLGVALLSGIAGYLVLDGASVPLLAAEAASSQTVQAYLGMAAVTVASCALVFMGGLIVRQATARG